MDESSPGKSVSSPTLCLLSQVRNKRVSVDRFKERFLQEVEQILRGMQD